MKFRITTPFDKGEKRFESLSSLCEYCFDEQYGERTGQIELLETRLNNTQIAFGRLLDFLFDSKRMSIDELKVILLITYAELEQEP